MRIRQTALGASSFVLLACGARTDPFVADLGTSVEIPGPDAGPSVARSDAEAADVVVVESGLDADATDATDATEASVPDAVAPDARAPLRIAFFGAPGDYDETALMAFLEAYPASVTRASTNSAPVTASSLASLDIVILDQLMRAFDSGEAAALATWVHGGGSVLSLSGYVNAPSDWLNPNSLLADFPLSYLPDLVLQNDTVSFVTEFAVHPVTAGLQAVPFWGGYQVGITGKCDGPTLPVAFAQGGTVAAVCQHGSGRVYLWGDEWVEYSSEWMFGVDTQLFWQDAINWLGHRD